MIGSLAQSTRICYHACMNVDMIRNRSRLYATIRDFFGSRNYLEVETPILAETLIPEPTIETFATRFSSEFHQSCDYHLIPSPEIYMKRLIAQGSGSIFQISKCFRNSEQIGTIHNPEFSMLEWYTIQTDYMDSIATTEALLTDLISPSTPDHIRPPFRQMSVAEACHRYAGFDLEKTQTLSSIREKAASLGLSPSAGPSSWEEEFNRIFLTYVEPDLPQDRPLILTDYPIQIRCLAKRKQGTPYRERWELYAGGIELANCYTEETDSSEIASLFREEYSRLITERIVTGAAIPDIDDTYASIFTADYPACSGVAMGLDRLLMVLYDIKTIQGVILFPFSDTIHNHEQIHDS